MVMLGTLAVSAGAEAEAGVGMAFVPQVVDTLHSWCTPTVLFVLLNIVIGTIAVTSRMRPNNNDKDENRNPNYLRRTPSLLARLPSFSFSKRAHEAEPDEWRVEPEPQKGVADNVAAEQDEDDEEMEEEVEVEKPRRAAVRGSGGGGGGGGGGLSQRAGRKKMGLGRSKSDTNQIVDLHPPPPPLPGKMHKYGTFEASTVNYQARPPVAPSTRAVAPRPPPPAYVQEEDNGPDASANAGGVDAKADDFINRFKQQLKLQRLESLVRYKDMINRK